MQPEVQPQKCVIQVNDTFLGFLEQSPRNVWLDGLHIRGLSMAERRSVTVDVQAGGEAGGEAGEQAGWVGQSAALVQWRPRSSSALWLTNVTLQGSSLGLAIDGGSAYIEGVHLQCKHAVSGQRPAVR